MDAPHTLTVEYADRPLGLWTATPRFAWHCASSDRDRHPASYRILVASAREVLDNDVGDLWDTGRRPMTAEPTVTYAGSPLRSRQRCWWKVRVWDDVDRPTPWSRQSNFELSLLDRSDWRASWIGRPGGHSGGALYLRQAFDLDQPATRARLYVAGLGFYQARLNGLRVGEDVLDPAPTDTSRRVPFATHDVTDRLVVGGNVLGAILGHGWSGDQKLVAQLEISLADGSEVLICTGQEGMETRRWQALRGPIIADSVYDGEWYDSRLESPGWDAHPPGRSLAPMRSLEAAVAVEPPGGILVPQSVQPIRVVETVRPVSIDEPHPGVFVIDTGRNRAGWLRIHLDAPSGAEVILRHAETCYPDGTVNQENLRSALATDRFIGDGSGRRAWEPTFTSHGFRYVQLEGWPGRPTLDDLEVREVRSAIPRTGMFGCDDPMISAINEAVYRTEAANLQGIPTDCPQRDERMGWLNDLAARSEELIHTFDTSRFLPKWVADISDTQDAAGAIADTAPYRFGSRPADPVSICYVLIPWLLVIHHGDVRTAAEHFGGAHRWFGYLASQAEDRILDYSHYGDWAPPVSQGRRGDDTNSALSAETPGRLVSTAHFYATANLLARLAEVLGRAEAPDLRREALLIKDAFNTEFWAGPATGYGSGNQACNAMALYLGLVPGDRREATVAALVAEVRRHDTHLTTGNLGTKYVLEALADHGHGELAVALLRQHTYPSWGFMINNGATTMWERWEYETGGGMNSHNHPMYGSVGAFLYRWLAGIRVSDQAIGLSEVVIAPLMTRALDRVWARRETVRGTLAAGWSRTAGVVRLSVELPPGVTGRIDLAAPAPTIRIDGAALGTESPGVVAVVEGSGITMVTLRAGRYEFTVPDHLPTVINY